MRLTTSSYLAILGLASSVSTSAIPAFSTNDAPANTSYQAIVDAWGSPRKHPLVPKDYVWGGVELNGTFTDGSSFEITCHTTQYSRKAVDYGHIHNNLVAPGVAICPCPNIVQDEASCFYRGKPVEGLITQCGNFTGVTCGDVAFYAAMVAWNCYDDPVGDGIERLEGKIVVGLPGNSSRSVYVY